MRNGHTLKIAIAGCGRIANIFHVPVLKAHEHVDIVAIADCDAGNLARTGEVLPDAKRLSSIEALIDVPGIDAVVICLPPAEHASAASLAFKAGKHVYVEKPLAVTQAEADTVLAAWRDSGKVGMMGYNFRFSLAYGTVRDMLRWGELGALVALRTTFLSAARELPPWKRQKSSGGGALFDLGGHHLDLIPFLTGLEVEAVQGSERAIATAGDTVSLAFELQGGVPAQMLLGLASGVSANHVEIVGTKGTVRCNAADPVPLTVERAPGKFARVRKAGLALRELDPRRLARSPGLEPSFGRALGAFVQACLAGKPVQPDIAAGHASLMLSLAAETSISERRRIEIAHQEKSSLEERSDSEPVRAR